MRYLLLLAAILPLVPHSAAATDVGCASNLMLGPSETLGCDQADWPVCRRGSQQAPKPYGYDFQHRFGRAYSHPAWIGPYEYGYPPYFGIESGAEQEESYEPWSQDGWPSVVPIPAPPEPEEE